MPEFVNPSNSQSKVYINEALREDISEASTTYEELKFRPDRVKRFLSGVDPREYISDPDSDAFSDYDSSLAEEIDSFTAPELVETLISSSEITDIEADCSQGLFQVNTYKTADMDESWTFWTPYVDDVSGEIVGLAKNPYTEEESAFTHAIDDNMSSSISGDRDIGDAVYMLAREIIPEGPEVARRTCSGQRVDENYLLGQFDIMEGKLGLISELEEAREIKTDNHTHATSNGPRGGHMAGALREFLGLAKDARVIDYTVSNENKENRVKISDGGYKHITRNLSNLGFSDSQELIQSRTAPKWKNDE